MIGENVLKRRRELGLTQSQLAEQVGVGQPTINGYEKNARTPSLPVLKNLAKALNCTVDELVG